MRIRDNFTVDQIISAMKEHHGQVSDAAKALSTKEAKVSSQLLRYWLSNEVELQPATEYADSAEAIIANRRNHVAKLKSSRELRKIADAIACNDDFLGEFLSIVDNIDVGRIHHIKPKAKPAKKNMIAELNISDVHWGVEIPGETNADLIDLRIQEVVRGFIQKLEQHSMTFNIVEIKLLLNGDLVEIGSHGSTGAEMSNPEQVARAIESVSKYVLAPLGALGYPMEVICIAGNHSYEGPGMQYSQGGRTTWDFVIYKSLELISEKMFKGDRVKFTIPSGIWHVYEIFNENCLVSHGTECKPTEAGLRGYANKVGVITRKMIHNSTIGHFHVANIFCGGAHYSNGSMVRDETGQAFSSSKGFECSPCQVSRFFIERDEGDRRGNIYDIFVLRTKN